jgi:uncharacterized protein (TIGR03067 family)
VSGAAVPGAGPWAGTAALDGAWAPLSADISGRELDIAELRVARLVIAVGRYRILDQTGHTVDAGELQRTDAESPQSPLALDLVGTEGSGAGRTIQTLAAIDGDRLLLCYDLEHSERPHSLEPCAEQLLLRITYVRLLGLFEANA